MSLIARPNVRIRCLSDLVRERQKKPDDEPMEIDEPMDFPTINESKNDTISSSLNPEDVLPNYCSNVIMSPIRREINGNEYWIYVATSGKNPMPLPSYQRLTVIPDDFFDHSYHDDGPDAHSTPINDGRIITPPDLSSISTLSDQSGDNIVHSNNLNPVVRENFDAPHSAHHVAHSTPLNDGRIIAPPDLSSISTLSDQSESALNRDNTSLPNNLNPLVHENFNVPHSAHPVAHSTPVNVGRIITPPDLSSISPLSDQSEFQSALNRDNIVLPNNLNPLVHENFNVPHSAHPYHDDGPDAHSTPLNDEIIVAPPDLSSISPLSDQSEFQSALNRDNIFLPNNLNPVVHENFDVPHSAHPVAHSTPLNDLIIVIPPDLSSINPLSDPSEYQSALNCDNIVLPNNLNRVVDENFDTPKLPRPEKRSAPPFDSLLDSHVVRNDNVRVQGTVDAQIFEAQHAYIDSLPF
uniref:Uncharacterized protein n=1 Tax=Panagrolaimus davidi TaxID=227884 RepID=A0A914R1U9_9BILA